MDDPKRNVRLLRQTQKQGYQARINRILATFAQMRIAQVKPLAAMLDEEMAKIEQMRDQGP